jgi:hypothetical protein
MIDEITHKFITYRTGDIVLSSGAGIGDLMIFIGRHDTVQHSCILIWLDIDAMTTGQVKIHPNFIDDETTTLSFLGLAQGARTDMITGEKEKGLILWNPEDLLANAPIAYIRKLSREYISDEYVSNKMEEYINLQHLKMQYAYGIHHIVTAGLGFDVFGRHKTGKICSENVYLFLEHLCKYPNFEIGNEKLEFKDYKVIDAVDYLHVPDFFLSSYNSHPVFENLEERVISIKNEDDVTVKHPFFVMFAVLVFLIIFIFLVINNYCDSCSRSGADFCPINAKDLFDSLI